MGPSYFGQAAFVQAFLGLEGSTARPRLRPRAIVEQVTDVLQPLGWEVSLSDKGAYALQSARLFGSLEELASALRSKATRALLDAYLNPTNRNDPGIYLSATRRRYFSLEEARGLVNGADVAPVVTELYDRNALVRGHVLKCEHCRATSFLLTQRGAALYMRPVPDEPTRDAFQLARDAGARVSVRAKRGAISVLEEQRTVAAPGGPRSFRCRPRG
jgi:hypothetical protein